MTTTSDTTVTRAQVVTVLKLLLGGATPSAAATATGLSVTVVEHIAEEYGHPDPGRVKAAVRDLQSADQASLVSTFTPRPPSRPAAPHVSQPAQPAPTRVQTEPVPGLKALLDRAAASGKSRTRTLGARVGDDVDKLLAALAAEGKEREAAERAAREDAERKRRIAQLEAELAELKGRKPAPAAPVPAGPSAREVREWAAANDVRCPANGRVPRVVREAYDAAHEASPAAGS